MNQPHNHDQPHDHDHNPRTSSHDHDHDQPHRHDHEQPHAHEHGGGLLAGLRELLPFGHAHSHAEVNVDDALEADARGIRAVKISLVGLGLTAMLQVVVVLISGSVALLADTIHNFSDALTAVPLWIAFALAKRPPSRRYTYGYGRAEDVAGLFIVLMILLSAVVAGYESVQKLFNPLTVTNLWWVAAAGVVGFLGNEAVAVFRIRVGRQVGSAALVADGLHARTDGLTSLAVLAGVIGVALGFPQADPLVGLLITVLILFVLKDAATSIWHRLMDAVDPTLVATIEHAASHVEGVSGVHNVQVRWLGHRLHAELHAVLPATLTLSQSHDLVEEVRHALYHHLPKLTEIVVHADPDDRSSTELSSLTSHHQPQADNQPAQYKDGELATYAIPDAALLNRQQDQSLATPAGVGRPPIRFIPHSHPESL